MIAPNRGGGLVRVSRRERVGAGGAAASHVRIAGREIGACVRCNSSDRFAVGAGGGSDPACGIVFDRSRSAPRRGACSVECDKPFTRELSGDTMRRLTAFWLSMIGAVAAAALTACAGAHIPPAPVTVAAGVTTRDSSAVQR